MKNILIFGNYPPPHGGVPEHIQDLLPYLEELDISVTVIAGGSAGIIKIGKHTIIKPTMRKKVLSLISAIFKKFFFSLIWHYGIKMSDLRSATRNIIYTQVGLGVVKEKKFSAAIFYNLYNYGYPACAVANKIQSPLIGNIFGEIYNKNLKQKKTKIFDEILARSDKMISCSTHCANSVRLLSSGIEVEALLYGVERRTVQRKIFSAQKKLKILFVGRHTREMGVLHFLSYLDNLRSKNVDFDARICGQSGELTEQILVQSRSNVYLETLSNLPRPELISQYDWADVVVVPTLGDRTCSSLAAMDAMMSGCIVFAHKVGGIPELIEHGRNGYLFAPGDVSSFLESFMDCTSSSSKMSALSKAAMRSAQTNFDKQKNYRKIAEILSDHAQ